MTFDMETVMELRIDHLLAKLKNDPEAILAAIDRDPLLMKREINGLVLSNATKELFTPQEEHHLYAKGIVYARDPYRLISLPLLKIYNLGERNITPHDLQIFAQQGANIRFLRKLDGSMIQRFQHDGRVYLTTRGMMDGIDLAHVQAETHFDYLKAARDIAEEAYPDLLQPLPAWEGLTMVLEFIHPDARIITDYGSRKDLVLIAVFDRREHRYWPYPQLRDFAASHRFNVTDEFEFRSRNFNEQIDEMLAEMAETDQEGSVINFEVENQVLYRVKVKSPSYLRLMRLMVNCTLANTVAMLNSFSTYPTWPEFEDFLKQQGTERVPEEVLSIYRQYYTEHGQFREMAAEIQSAVALEMATILTTITETEPRAKRAAVAKTIQHHPLKALLFAELDGRLTLSKVNEFLETPERAFQFRQGLNSAPATCILEQEQPI